MPHADQRDNVILALAILRHIPQQSYISASALCDKLRVAGLSRNIRTIQRQLKMLCEHFDIECDMRSKPYGYRWKRHAGGFGMPEISESEALLLTLAASQLKSLLPEALMPTLSSLFDHAQRKLVTTSQQGNARQWLEKVAIVPLSQPLIPMPITADVFSAVSHALYHNCWLDVGYTNQQGHSMQKRVMPLALVQQDPSLYLVVQYQGCTDYRHLALHRMRTAKVSSIHFTRPTNFSLAQYQAAGHFIFTRGKQIKLTFSISKARGFHLTETRLSEDQTIITEDEKYYRFSATVLDSLVLDQWLASFGKDVWDVSKESLPKTDD